MAFDIVRKRSKGAAGQGRTASGPPLHSISAVLKQRDFVGSFEVAGEGHRFVYIPSEAGLSDQKLQLRGRLEITGPRDRKSARDDVRALLASAQGGIGVAPVRRQVLVGGVGASTASTSGQQQQIAGEKLAAEPKKTDAADPPKPQSLPEVESTGPLSFCGAMYFHLDPLNGRSLGVAADLTRVQLNVRLAPVDETGRTLQGLYSSIVDALYGGRADVRSASAVIAELNKLLVAG
ncbi:MAG TPA: hypothetical protein VF762_13165 [Blastocatellia bacterium]|jgi:hypothetical protein